MPTWFSRLLRRRPAVPQTRVPAPQPKWQQVRAPTGGGLASHATPRQVLALQRQLGNRATSNALMSDPGANQNANYNNADSPPYEDVRGLMGADGRQGSNQNANYNNADSPPYEDVRGLMGADGRQGSNQNANYNNADSPPYEDVRGLMGADGRQGSNQNANYNNAQSTPVTERAPVYENDIGSLLSTMAPGTTTTGGQSGQPSTPPSVQKQQTANSLWALDAHLRAKHGLAPLFPATKQLAMNEFSTTNYLSPLESQSMTLTFRGGMLMRRMAPGPDQPPGKWQLEPYDTTSNADTMHGDPSEKGQALYVLSEGGTLLSAPGKVREMHHSSLLAGTAVAGAGMMRVEQGKVRSISNASGHYRPTADYLRNVLNVLQRNHVNLDEVAVQEAPHSTCDRSHLNGHREDWNSGTEWLAFHDEPLQDASGPSPQSIGHATPPPGGPPDSNYNN